MTYTPPCKQGDPEDWFIETNGLQYLDDPVVIDEAEVEVIHEKLGTDRDVVRRALRARAKRDALIRRRKAKQACHTDCRVRLECLNIALEERPMWGIWGGYFPEELRVVYGEQDRRRGRVG